IEAARALFADWDEPAEDSGKPRLGIPEGEYLQNVLPESAAHFDRVYQRLEEAGYEVQRIPLFSDFAAIRARHDVILSAEAADVHADWFREYERFYSPKFTELIRRGQQITHTQLQEALAERDS